MKTKVMILSMVILMSSAFHVFAGDGHNHGDEKVIEAIEVGNNICPVSGEEIGGEMGDPKKIEYNGNTYNLCCDMCVKDFNKDPEKYSKIAETEAMSHANNNGNEKGSSEDHHDHAH